MRRARLVLFIAVAVSCGQGPGPAPAPGPGTASEPQPQPPAGPSAGGQEACTPGLTFCGTSIFSDRQSGCYDLQTAYNACGSCDAMPCRQSWDGSSHAPGRCERGVCATTP